MDVQGAEKVRPWVTAAAATYPALVDSQGRLAADFGFNYVPLTLLVDEEGRLVRGPTGTNIDRESDWTEIASWLRTGSIAPSSKPTETSGFTHPEAKLRFEAAAVALTKEQSDTALDLLQGALQLDSENWLIRKQIWAIQNPDRFYDGPIDFEWQKQQLRKDKDR